MFTGRKSSIVPLGIIFLTAILNIAPLNSQIRPHRALGVKEADDLVAYANQLSLRGNVVQINDQGLNISGQSLSGNTIRRPADALARAAEIYAEYAQENQDRRILTSALTLWKRIGRPEFAIPYLRLYSKNANESREPFALFCHVKLAALYEEIGDSQSANEIYELYLNFEPTDVLEVYASASAAERMLELGRLEEATKIAQAAVKACDPGLFTYGPGEDGYTIAVAVLKRIPGAEIPTIQTSTESGTPQSNSIARAEDNPRHLLRLGEMDFRTKNYQGAISKWQNYQRRFPNEDQSRLIALRIGTTYELLKQIDKANEAYSLVETQYPDFPEWWKAVQAKALLKEAANQPEEAQKYLIESIQKARNPESAAALTLGLAELCLRNKKTDEATNHYITLLTKYSDQDASRAALTNLLKIAPRMSDWKKLADGIQSWFSQNWSLGSRSETKNLSVADASRLRRLVLGFYSKSNDIRGGIRWITDQRRINDQAHQQFLDKDEAWLYGYTAQNLTQIVPNLTARNLEQGIEYGLAAWKLSPKTEEGINGLKAAVALSTHEKAQKRLNRNLASELNTLLNDPDLKQEAYSMLLSYYTYIGEKKALDDLKKLNLE